ncbi:MAG: DUF4115 domain-containing protein [Gammaproteobacteria bacterium]|nr:DUF4115 domain-containing protein [Gammaproteobacteria bacterium]
MEQHNDYQVDTTEPGASLAAGREKAGMSREQVADRLHLSTKQIEALEINDWKGLPEAPYVRGYIRNYALLVGIDDRPLVDAFKAQQAKEKKQAEPVQAAVKAGAVATSQQQMMTIGAVVAVIAIVLVIFLFNGSDERRPAQPVVAPTISERLGNTDTVEPGQSPLSDADGSVVDTGAVTDQADANPVLPLDPAIVPQTAPVVPQPKPAEPMAQVAPNAQQVTPTLQQKAETAASQAQSAVPGSAQLVFSLDADSWLDVRDNSGKRLVYETVSGGRVISLNGEAPFNVFIGNAVAVRLVYNGKDFDIAPHRRGMIARFTLN